MSIDITHGVTRRAMFAQWVMLLLFLGTITTVVGVEIAEKHRLVDANERHHLLIQARAIGANLSEQMATTYRALSEIRAETTFPNHGAHNTQLKTLVNILRGVSTINILDLHGVIVASNHDELIGTDLSAHEYFKAAKSLTDPDGVVISPPFKTVLGAWGLNMVLPLHGPGYTFAGLVSATLDKDYFLSLLTSVHFAPDMLTLVVHEGGVLFVVAPKIDNLEGKILTHPESFFSQHVQSGLSESVFSGKVYTTGDERIGAYVTVRAAHADRALMVAASRNMDAIFAGWQQDAIESGLLLSGLFLATITGLTVYQKRTIAATKQNLRATEQLQQSEARFRAIIEASPVPFALNDAQQNITYLNAAFTRAFGYTQQDIPTLSEWWPRAYPDANYREWVATTWATHLQTAQREHPPFASMEFNICCKNGDTRTARVGATRLDESFGDTHLVVLFDITDVKSAEAQRERLQAQLRQAQKMEAIGQLTGGIAHDFNNILASILGYTELLRAQMPNAADDKASRYLDQIQRAGERARDLIAKMLAFARGTSSAPRVLDPHAAIREIINILRPTLPPGIKIDHEIDPLISSMYADPVQAHQIISNLLINARDALHGNGVIRVGLYRASAHDATCNACGKHVNGEYFTLSVSDNGSGIAPEHLPHIFNPFYTTKEVGKGTGLGLSVVHGIVHEMGGHILVDSSADSGTTFRVLFPVIPVQEVTHDL